MPSKSNGRLRENLPSRDSTQDSPQPGKRPLSFTRAAYNELRRRIIECRLEPGRLLTEAELVRELDIGKTPIREALMRLIQDGLVTVIPRHGYQVTPITLQDVYDLFALRLIIEPAAMELAAGRLDVTLHQRLDELCDIDYSNPTKAARTNTEFHVTAASASGNRRLAECLSQLLEEGERLYHLGILFRSIPPMAMTGEYRSQDSTTDHRALIAALVADDKDAARRVATDQILQARQDAINALLASPSLREAAITVSASAKTLVFDPETSS